MRAKFVNEKFKEGTDPVRDMGIGFKEILKQELSILGPLSPERTSEKFFGTRQYDKEGYFIYLFLTLLAYKDDVSYQNIYTAFEEAKEHSHVKSQVKSLNFVKINQALKDNYNIVV